jgi:hypothetical protein
VVDSRHNLDNAIFSMLRKQTDLYKLTLEEAAILIRASAYRVCVTVHSPSQREGAGGMASGWHNGISPLPTSPRWGEESERLRVCSPESKKMTNEA